MKSIKLLAVLCLCSSIAQAGELVTCQLYEQAQENEAPNEIAKIGWLFKDGQIIATAPKIYSDVQKMPIIINPLQPIEFDLAGNEVIEVQNQRIKKITLTHNFNGTRYFFAKVKQDQTKEGANTYIVDGTLKGTALATEAPCQYKSFNDSEINKTTLDKYKLQISMLNSD